MPSQEYCTIQTLLTDDRYLFPVFHNFTFCFPHKYKVPGDYAEDCCLALVIFTFSCCFRLLLTFYARLLVMLSLTNLLLDTSLSAASLETT